MEYIKVSDKVVRFKKEIRNHAFSSIYRLNAKSCDCYTFYYYRLDNGKEAFGGSWDWKSDLKGNNNVDYFLDLDNNCFYSIFND